MHVVCARMTDEFLELLEGGWQRSVDAAAGDRVSRSVGGRPMVPVRVPLEGGFSTPGWRRRSCWQATHASVLEWVELGELPAARDELSGG